MKTLGWYRDWLYRKPLAPSVESASQGRSFYFQSPQLPRHPGAGSLVGSSAVGHHQTFRSIAGRPFRNLVRQRPDTARYLSAVTLVAGPGSHVENGRWVGTSPQAVQICRSNARHFPIVAAEQRVHRTFPNSSHFLGMSPETPLVEWERNRFQGSMTDGDRG